MLITKRTRRNEVVEAKKINKQGKKQYKEKKGNKIYENRFNVGDAIRLEPHYEDELHDEYSIWDVVSVRPEEMSYMYELESNDSSLRLSRPEVIYEKHQMFSSKIFMEEENIKKRRVKKEEKNNSYTIQMILVNHLMSILIKIKRYHSIKYTTDKTIKLSKN